MFRTIKGKLLFLFFFLLFFLIVDLKEDKRMIFKKMFDDFVVLGIQRYRTFSCVYSKSTYVLRFRMIKIRQISRTKMFSIM